MFKLNPNRKLYRDNILNTDLFIIDDFYHNPDEVKDYLEHPLPPLWKQDIKQLGRHSNNGFYFEDRRLQDHNPDLVGVYEYLSILCDQPPVGRSDWVQSNMTRFIDFDYNTYAKSHWWPHFDYGYNGIVYLNYDGHNGTNIYEVSREELRDRPADEHEEPWRDMNKYRVIKELIPKFNRMVLFDGAFPHGMNITDDRFFHNDYRTNQVFFFKPDN